MNKIATQIDWNRIDCLDGIPLEDGEMLRVRWPDGHLETLRVYIEATSQEYTSHGSIDKIRTQLAYALLDHHGAPSRLYLVGQEAERA